MNNRNNKRNVRRPLTREEAILAEKRRIEERQRRIERKRLAEKITGIGIFSLIGTFIALIIIFAYIFVDFRATDKEANEPVKVTYQNNDTVVLDDDFYSHKNGEYYISLTKLSKLCSFTLHGNSKNMTLTIADGKSARFDTGTPNVKIGSTYSILKNPSYFYGGHLFIPVSFFEDMCKGIKCEFDKLGKVRGFNLIFDEGFSFKALDSVESMPVQRTSLAADGETPLFKADLSDYEMYMNPENKDEYLILINDNNKLSESDVPDDLIEVADTRGDRAKAKMRLYAAKALEAMFIEMRANGFYDMGVISGYRSYSYQESLVENETNAFLSQFDGDREKAKQNALSSVAAPGASEHQSGLCVDMSNSTVLSEALSETDIYKWLYSNCADFGFILRYPKDKTDITGIIFEPWHYRYVGRYHAKRIMDAGLCLEEYIAELE